MPMEIWLVRHLRSRNNESFELWADQGDDSVLEELRQRTGNTPLSPEGIEQGNIMNQLAIREGWDFRDSVCLTSTLLRARQSAARMRWPNVSWQTEPRLRERREHPPEVLAERFISFPPGVDRRAELQRRGDRFSETDEELFRRAEDLIQWILEEHAGRERVVLLTHRFNADALSAVIEGMSLSQYLEWIRGESSKPYRKIKNGGIVMYSCRHPLRHVQHPGEYRWVRFVDPFDLGRTDPSWVSVDLPRSRSARSPSRSESGDDESPLDDEG